MTNRSATNQLVRPSEMPISLALAMVVSSKVPLLLLDEDLAVIAVSDSWCSAFGIEPQTVAGNSVFALGQGEWNVPQFRSLLEATAAGGAAIDAYEMELRRPGREAHCLVMNARTLDYGDLSQLRLLLTIADITEEKRTARANDDLVREKAVLLQEVQHRVANSLQIIASVLLQSARKVQSEESRGHLKDAHHRLMSVAALQRQLSISSTDMVPLRTYLKQLCGSIGASMIADHARLSIEVACDDSVVTPLVSISLGLIVTELVINALKHGFVDQRAGTIIIGYRGGATGWRLSVADNGVGMAAGRAIVPAGLGTSIVEALVKRLDATTQLIDRHPGTRVVITHAAANPVVQHAAV